MHDNFGVRTEELMHKLFDTSSEALKASATIGSALSGVNKQLSSMGGVLSRVHQQQEQLSSLGQATLAQSQLINTQVANIQGGLQAVQTAGVSRLYGIMLVHCFPKDKGAHDHKRHYQEKLKDNQG